MEFECWLRTGKAKMYCLVPKMVVQWKSNAVYGQKEVKKCTAMSKMMVRGKSNADYGQEKAKECIVLFVNDGSMGIERWLWMRETKEMCCFVRKMMVLWKSNADAGLKEPKQMFSFVCKRMVWYKSNANYGQKKAKECFFCIVRKWWFNGNQVLITIKVVAKRRVLICKNK